MFSSSVKIGLLFGFLFFAHALIPGSHAWPLIWPLLAGGIAVYLHLRRGRLHGFAGSLGVSAKTGLTAAGIFFVATIAALAVLGQPGFGGAARLFGAEGPIVVNAAILTALGFAAFLGFVAAMLAGALVYPLTRQDG